LLDDYAYHGYRQQKLGMDRFAASRGVQVLSLPTGQGLLIKPPRAAEHLASRELARIKASRSWRLTAPLRALSRWLVR
jgi:hypothetical protein